MGSMGGSVEFLRDYGPHFSVNRMLAMDSVKVVMPTMMRVSTSRACRRHARVGDDARVDDDACRR